MEAKDPYKYFRIEARELLTRLDQGLLELSKGSTHLELRQTLMRFAHTLKGAARVVKHQAIADLAHRFEDDFNPFREASRAVPADALQQLSSHVRVMGELVDALSVPPAPATISPTGNESDTNIAFIDEHFETVRVEVATMEVVAEAISDVGVQLRAAKLNAGQLDHARRLIDAVFAQLPPPRTQRNTAAEAVELVGRMARLQGLLEELRQLFDTSRRSFENILEQSEARLEELRDRVNVIRLLPASAIFPTLERAAVDVALQLGKTIEFRVSGGEHRLDGHVLGHVRDALLHMVRNAVDHGIENVEERAAKRKPAPGVVEIIVERRGDRMIFRCRDDGRGIDVAAIRQTLARRGRGTAEEISSLDDAAVVQLLLEGGFSSRNEITQISGRGIGMDVVRETAERLKGRVTCTFEPDKGAEISLSVPLSLSSMTVLLAAVGDHIVGLPLENIRRTLWVSTSDIATAVEGEQIAYENRAIPFCGLSKLLDPQMLIRQRRHWSVVVLSAGSETVSVGVDRLLGSTEIILKPLPAVVGALPLICGTAVDFEGNPQPILDPEGVVAAVRAGLGHRERELLSKPQTILVVDDSLTTRMLEQNILESAGYRVDLAVSGEDGLEKARATRYDLFVVDVEMPGMNGFEFIRHTREDATLHDIPAILVTSVATPEAKQRGREVGASAYIVKGEFEQGVFMETVRKLVGQVTLAGDTLTP